MKTAEQIANAQTFYKNELFRMLNDELNEIVDGISEKIFECVKNGQIMGKEYSFALPDFKPCYQNFCCDILLQRKFVDCGFSCYIENSEVVVKW